VIAAAEQGRRSRVPALVATLAAPALLYFICRNAALGLSPQVAALAGAAMPPADYSVAMRSLVRVAQVPEQKVTPQMASLLRPASLSAPLGFEPFIVAAKLEGQAGRPNQALLLLEEAKRRRPTRLATRGLLAFFHAQRGDYARFVGELDWLLRRSGRLQDRVLPEMVKGVADPAGRRALADLLAKSPPWREQFYRVAADRGVQPQQASELVALVRERRKSGSFEAENLFEMQALLNARRYGEARAVWEKIVGPAAVNSSSLVFDGAFRGSPAPAPFNWQLRDTDVGRATLAGGKTESPHLEVEYFGGKDASLAEQLLTLQPGRHELRLNASSAAPPKSGSVSWRLTCRPSTQEVARLELSNLRDQAAPYATIFTVPEGGCSAQSLQLVAEAGDYSGASHMTMANLGIRRLN